MPTFSEGASRQFLDRWSGESSYTRYVQVLGIDCGSGLNIHAHFSTNENQPFIKLSLSGTDPPGHKIVSLADPGGGPACAYKLASKLSQLSVAHTESPSPEGWTPDGFELALNHKTLLPTWVCKAVVHPCTWTPIFMFSGAI